MSHSVGFRNLWLRILPALLASFALAFLAVSCSQTDGDSDADTITDASGAAPTDLLLQGPAPRTKLVRQERVPVRRTRVRELEVPSAAVPGTQPGGAAPPTVC